MIRILNVYYPTRTVILLMGEAMLVGACFLLATRAMLGPDTYIALAYEHGLLKIAGLLVLTVGLSYYFDLYEPQIVSVPHEIYFRILLVLGFVCFIVAATIFFFPGLTIAPSVYAIGLGILTPGLIVCRKAYDWATSRKFLRERVYVLGSGDSARSIVQMIRSRTETGMEIVGWSGVDFTKEQRRSHWVEELERASNMRPPLRRIIVALEDRRDELPEMELLRLRFRGIVIEEVGTLYERICGKMHLDSLQASSLLYSEGFRVTPTQQLGRRMVSTLAAAIGLLLFLPFFPIVVLLVRLTSKGPVFFRQVRVGLGGKPFEVIKFRTMFIDAESTGAKWATKNDPRVTVIGMFMRKTRIDEIPQLWNVIRGDMNLVGPRPERPEFIPWLSEQLPFYGLRNLIRPGLTGWAQVRYGYGATLEETKEKLQYDLYYIKYMSLGLDLLIMFETIKTIVRRRGAQ